jgi:hypothetical protein
MARNRCSSEVGTTGVERTSRRVQNGVEIIERESVRTIRFEDDAYINSGTGTLPRLVIEDAISRSKLFITRSRSQLGDIDAFLRTIVRRPIEAK